MAKAPEKETAPAQQQQQMQQVPDLSDVPVANENVSLNLMVGFLNVAQKRGAFNVQESAKLWEAISAFQKK